MRVKSLSGPFPPGSIGRIHEKDRIGSMCAFPQTLQAVAVNEEDTLAPYADFKNAFAKRFRIPA